MDYYLRLVTYGIVAGDVTPIEEIGVREMQKPWHSIEGVAKASVQ